MFVSRVLRFVSRVLREAGDSRPVRPPRRRACGVLVAFSLPLALVACTTPVASTGGVPRATTSASSSKAEPTAQLTGAQLKQALLGDYGYPEGFAVEPGSESDTGPVLKTAPSKIDITAADCSTFISTDVLAPGLGESAFAGENVRNPATQAAMGQYIRQFATGTAATAFYDRLLKKVQACGDSDAQTLFSGIGQADFALGWSLSAEGKTIDFELVFALDGTDIYTVAPIGDPETSKQLPDERSMLKDLIMNVSAMEQG